MTQSHKMEFSLNEIESLLKNSSHAQNFLRKEFVSSYEEFVEILYDDMDLIIVNLESNPQFYSKDEEDRITHDIVTMLKMRNYAASQGTTSGGNVDLTVSGSNPAWSWIGEAKIFKSVTDLREGFLQLTTRYRTASPNYACAGILAYTKRINAAGCLHDWEEAIRGMELEDLEFSECTRRGKLAFYTTHKHEATGLPIKIRHNAISLHHLPKDKSGRTAAKHGGTKPTRKRKSP